MQFLNGSETLESIARLLISEDTEIAIAVAFWGGAAAERLSIKKWTAQKIRLVCNAASGACNPETLRFLSKKFGASFKTNLNLHAKVYWTPRKVIITSANASASGLYLEDGEITGNIEAGVASTSQQLIGEVKDWFNNLFASPGTKVVDKAVIKAAEKTWERRRQDRVSVATASSIIEALKSRGALRGRNIFVVNYSGEDRSDEAEKTAEAIKKAWKAGL
jgi:hypothetical protein